MTRTIQKDYYLPVGRLRESAMQRYRANMLIVTKQLKHTKSIDRRLFEWGLDLYPSQDLFFSKISYDKPRALLALAKASLEEGISFDKKTNVIALSGIAVADPFFQYIEEHYYLVDKLEYSDHYNFQTKDIKDINEHYNKLKDELKEPVYLLCTEKDAIRLQSFCSELDASLLQHLYYLPISIQIDNDRDEVFNHIIEKVIHSIPKIK